MKDLLAVAENDASLVASYRPRLLYFFLRRLRDRSLAEELAQDTLLVVLQALRDNRLEDRAKLPAFIFGVAKNLVSKAVRERSVQAASGEEEVPVGQSSWLEDPDAALMLSEQRRQIREALDQLSPSDHDILRRTFLAEQPLEEIAAEVGISNAVIRKRKSRALERLRKLFQERSQKKLL